MFKHTHMPPGKGEAKPPKPKGKAAAVASLSTTAMAVATFPAFAEATRERTATQTETTDGCLLKMVKKAMFATAIASVRTFDPSSPAGAITRLVESASGVAAAAVYAPELIKTEQRWLVDGYWMSI